MRFNHSLLHQFLKYPFMWFPDFFDYDAEAVLQIASLQCWKDHEFRHYQINDIHNVPRTASSLRHLVDKLCSPETIKELEPFGAQSNSSITFMKMEEDDYIDSLPLDTGYLELFLSPGWEHTWGGITEFSKTTSGYVALPKAGSALLVLKDKTWNYRVTSIQPWAPIPRLSIILSF